MKQYVTPNLEILTYPSDIIAYSGLEEDMDIAYDAMGADLFTQ